MLNTARKIAYAAQRHGGIAYMVGGCVRDYYLRTDSKDLDMEIYAISQADVESLLAELGSVDFVGKSFGVYKLQIDGMMVDVSLPRREVKNGSGHTGFSVEVDPFMPLESALARRDFTMNAMAFDPIAYVYIDPYNGLEDLRNEVLNATSVAFGEDPLRVLRAMQFIARFDLTPSPSLHATCAELYREYTTLPVERVWGEWEKLCLRGTVISPAMYFLVHSTWIRAYPELLSLFGIPQSPKWHAEGDAFRHTCMVADVAVQIADTHKLAGDDRVVLILAAICHDMGKVNTTVVHSETKITSYGHADTGVPIAQQFLGRIGAPKRIVDRVLPLVREHMMHLSLGDRIKRSTVLKLADRLYPETIRMLHRLVEADHLGRLPQPQPIDRMTTVLFDAQDYGVIDGRPQPIVTGKMLIAHGVVPGVAMGAIIKAAYQAQLRDQFRDEQGAVVWLMRNKHIPRRS